MEITPRQYGRLEMAAWALAKHSEHNEVCMVLAKGVMQVLDEIADGDDLDELRREIPDWEDRDLSDLPDVPDKTREPDVPDWRDGAARQTEDDLLVRCRLIVAAHQGDGLAEIIRAIKEDGTDQKTLAGILGVNPARITEAVQGKPRPSFVARFAEVLGEGADLSNEYGKGE